MTSMDDDNDDCYGDEWASEQADNEDEGDFGAGLEAVHPLPSLDKRGELGTGDDGIPVDSQTAVHSSQQQQSCQDAAIGSNARLFRDESMDGAVPAVERGDQGDDILARHTRRYERMPPPPPHAVHPTTSMTGVERSQTDHAALYARVAAIRISEYREMARAKREEVRQHEAELAQRQRAVRYSNKSIHEAYGVANLTPMERLRLTLRVLKNQARESERASDLDRKNRWYNKQQARRDVAPAHAHRLLSKALQARRAQEQMAHDAKVRVRLNQARLKQEANILIAKSTCEYVRGSYLLKVPVRNAHEGARLEGSTQRAITSASVEHQ